MNKTQYDASEYLGSVMYVIVKNPMIGCEGRQLELAQKFVSSLIHPEDIPIGSLLSESVIISFQPFGSSCITVEGKDSVCALYAQQHFRNLTYLSSILLDIAHQRDALRHSEDLHIKWVVEEKRGDCDVVKKFTHTMDLSFDSDNQKISYIFHAV